MTKQEKYTRLCHVLYWVVTASFIITLIYVPIRVITDKHYRENAEYVIMIFQTIMGLLIINLPSFLSKRFMWKIPPMFAACFILFLFGAIFLGEALMFYYRVPNWDNILHFFSSMMLGLLGFSLIDILNGDKKHSLVKLSPFFVCLFSISFALLIGVLWEIYEFTFDGLLGMNMQKFAVEALEDGEKLVDLVGREALADTMHDLIIDLAGATIISLAGYVTTKRGKGGWLEAFRVEVGSSKASSAVVAESIAPSYEDTPASDRAHTSNESGNSSND